MNKKKQIHPMQTAFEKTPDVALFLTFTLIGIILLISLRLLNKPVIVTLVLAVIMISFYGTVVFLTRRFQLSSDQSADNCYYMGLLFTLTAIAYSLWAVVEQGHQVESIISDMGISLGSTIVGLIWRLALSQMRSDPIEVEESIRLQLSESARLVKGQLQEVSSEFEVFSTSLRQVFQETSKSLAISLADTMDQANIKLTSSIEGSSQKLASSSEKVLSSIEVAFAEFTENTQKLNRQAQKTVDAMEQMATRLQALETPENFLTSRFEPIITTIENSVERLSNLETKHATKLGELGGVLEKMQGSGNALNETMSALSTGLRSVVGISQELENVKIALKEVNPSISDLKSNNVEFGNEIRIKQKEFLTQIIALQVECSNSSKEMTTALSDMANAISEAFTDPNGIKS